MNTFRAVREIINLYRSGITDQNPVKLPCGAIDKPMYVCGPTTGAWMEANGIRFACVRYVCGIPITFGE